MCCFTPGCSTRSRPGARADNQPCKVCVYMITKLILPSLSPPFPFLPTPLLLSILPFLPSSMSDAALPSIYFNSHGVFHMTKPAVCSQHLLKISKAAMAAIRFQLHTWARAPKPIQADLKNGRGCNGYTCCAPCSIKEMLCTFFFFQVRQEQV